MIKLYCIILLTVISTVISHGQNNDTWTSFWDKDTLYFGYKDKSGIIKIEPKFLQYSKADKFDNIIAVMENFEGDIKRYYLTKKGIIVGRDSLYTYDNTTDCENEGFIRFRDYKTNKAGLFNKKGDIVIPAEYNDLTNVRNGMLMALKGAEKECISYCEHFNWIGGKELLIDTSNNVLIDNFKRTYNLNFFSVKISNEISSDPIRQSFKAADKRYYSFIDFEKEFDRWLKNDLLNNLTVEKLLSVANDEITYWEKCKGWTSENKTVFFERNFELIKSILIEIASDKCDYNIRSERLSQGIYKSKYFEKFFNNCWDSKYWIYPVMEISTINKIEKYYENDFSFLRTDKGYKLIGISLKTEYSP